MSKIAILQPNYIPWKGVFDLIDSVDFFVFYDDVQYTKKDWRNRNRIKTKNGDVWITVPVLTSGAQYQLIRDVKIDQSQDWQMKHFKTIENNYKKAPFFEEYKYILSEIYLNRQWTSLSELNIFSTKLIAKALGINVNWFTSSELGYDGSKDGERVVKLCKALKCDHFINGPSSKEFMNSQIFEKNNIILEYKEYNYKTYNQLYKPFTHAVSILDVLFNCGPNSMEYIKSE